MNSYQIDALKDDACSYQSLSFDYFVNRESKGLLNLFIRFFVLSIFRKPTSGKMSAVFYSLLFYHYNIITWKEITTNIDKLTVRFRDVSFIGIGDMITFYEGKITKSETSIGLVIEKFNRFQNHVCVLSIENGVIRERNINKNQIFKKYSLSN
jgi:hypothetical protein